MLNKNFDIFSMPSSKIPDSAQSMKMMSAIDDISSFMEIDGAAEQPQSYIESAEKLRNILTSGGDRTSGKGQLMNKFLNSVIQKASNFLDEGESCSIHKNEYLVAVDFQQKRFGCERCVYEGVHIEPKFVSLAARDIKDEFDEAYFLYTQNQNGIQSMTPQIVAQNVKGMVSSFFSMIRKQLDEMEVDVQRKIRDSDLLRGLQQKISDMTDFVDDNLTQMLELEKQTIDTKCERGQFTFLILKVNFYRTLSASLRSLNHSIKGEIENSEQMFKDVVTFESHDDYMREQLNNIMNKCLKIDNQDIKMEPKPKAPSKIQDSVQKCQYIMKENRILQLDLIDKKINEIHQLKDLYMSKLMTVDDNNAYIIGGQSSMDYGRDTIIKRTCYHLSKDARNTWITKPQGTMKKMRVSFGASFIGSAKDYILVTGGYSLVKKVIAECEVFNIHDNFWVHFPPMHTKRASHSLTSTDNFKWVYAFGGTDEGALFLDSIERIKIVNINNPSEPSKAEWQVINVQLQQRINNVGCLQVAPKEILIFGGFNSNGDIVTNGSIMMIENEETGKHVMMQGAVDLAKTDIFTNNQSFRKGDDSIFAVGVHFVHSINLKGDRKFTTALEIK